MTSNALQLHLSLTHRDQCDAEESDIKDDASIVGMRRLKSIQTQGNTEHVETQQSGLSVNLCDNNTRGLDTNAQEHDNLAEGMHVKALPDI